MRVGQIAVVGKRNAIRRVNENGCASEALELPAVG